MISLSFMKIIINSVALNQFYNKVYGDFKYENGESFLINYYEKLDNTDIEATEHKPELPELYKENPRSLIDYSYEDLNKMFDNLRHTTYVISYTHPINQPMAPPT